MTDPEPEIGSFLKARRAALAPAELGLPDGPSRRRVRGLRREEVAQLAGISVDYYTRIEQGRSHNISDSVLDAIARALRMTPAEHTYLRNITLPRRGGAHGTQRVRPEIRQLLDAMDGTVPAMIYGRGMEILAWNRLAGRVSFDIDAVPEGERNGALLIFLHPAAKELYPDWEQGAQETVASLRAEVGRYPDDPGLRAVIAELQERSADFRRHWDAQAVQERLNGIKRIMNPLVGELVISYETFRLPGDPDQTLCTYTAEPGSPTAEALRELARLTETALAARAG
jgi:transcriptional regulator with XRE-family HTH domain